MPRESFEFPRWVAALGAAFALWALYLYGLDAMGVVGPDEPRYASIGRAMAMSGDWVTPRLWGTPWFEKPALLYWMVAAGFRTGLPPEWASRLPVALLSVAFLIGYWWMLRRAFGQAAATCASIFLGTSAGWVAFSAVAVTDLPLAAFSAFALLLVLDLLPDRHPSLRRLCTIAALLGGAVLAKGLVPLVLALPAGWALRRHWRKLLHPAPMATFLAVALPWYLLCWMRNGNQFLYTFFVQHQLGRFTSDALQHVRPFWFYVPVLIAGVYPWSILLPMVFRRSLWQDARTRYLVQWFVFGILFFSASRNKLPGYLLPLLPPLMALMGVSIMRTRRAAPLLALTCILLIGLPLAMFLLPAALAQGGPLFPIPEAAALRTALFLPIAFILAALVYFGDRQGTGRVAMLITMGAVVCLLVGSIKRGTLPVIDASVSPRALWHSVERQPDVCVADIHRAWRYGLNYYSLVPLPDCAVRPAAWQVLPGTPRPVLSRPKP
jgi:4-amino-4-deoxy-L-arabinose transferase-like glycosyltransferase